MTEQTAELCRQVAARIRSTEPPALAPPSQAGARGRRNGSSEYRPVSAEEFRAAWLRVADAIGMIGGAEGSDDSLFRVTRGVLSATDRLVYTDEEMRNLRALAAGEIADPDHQRWGRHACEATAARIVAALLDTVPLGGGWHVGGPWGWETPDPQRPGRAAGLRPAIRHLTHALSSYGHPDDADRHARAGLESLAGRWVAA